MPRSGRRMNVRGENLWSDPKPWVWPSPHAKNSLSDWWGERRRRGRVAKNWPKCQSWPKCQVRRCEWKEHGASWWIRYWYKSEGSSAIYTVYHGSSSVILDQILILLNIFPTIPKTKLRVVQQYKVSSHVFAFQIATKLCDNIDTHHSWSFWRWNDNKPCDGGANDQHFGAYHMIW